jgi:multidrug resistance efflux pump
VIVDSPWRYLGINLRRAFRYAIVWRTVTFLIAVAVLAVIATHWNRWEGDAEWQSTDDAYLQADLTPISAKVTGYIRALPVQDFERVGAGQLLAEIVDDDYRAAVAQINAGILIVTRRAAPVGPASHVSPFAPRNASPP